MKVAILGTFTQANLEAFLASAFRDLGHQVVEFDAWKLSSPPWYRRNVVNLISGLPRVRHSYRAGYQQFVNHRALEFLQQQKPDLIVCHNGAELHPDTVKSIVKKHGIPFTTYVADDPTLGLLLPEYLPCLPHFTHVFASESALVRKLRMLTKSRVEFVSCGAPDHLYRPMTASAGEKRLFECNIGYVSSGYSGSPYGVYRALMLSNVADLGLKIFGDRHWRYIAKRVPEVSTNINVTGFLNVERMNAFFASSQIFMGIVHPQMVSGVGQRIFDAAAAGAFILAEYKLDIDWAFPDGEVETFKSREEMRQKAKYYLAHPDERRAKAQAARRRVLAEHTWRHKAQQILEIISN